MCEGVESQPTVALLVFEPVSELAEELGQHASHARERGDDLGGVGGAGEVSGGGAGALVELADGLRGLVGLLAGRSVVRVVGAGHQNGGSPSPLPVSSAVNRSRLTRRPRMS